MNREKLIKELMKELPGLLADYEFLSTDSNGKVEENRRKRIDRLDGLRLQIEFGVKVLSKRKR